MPRWCLAAPFTLSLRSDNAGGGVAVFACGNQVVDGDQWMGNWIGLRTALPLVLVMAVAISLNVFLTLAKSESSFAAVEDSRFRFIVERIKGAVQNNLDLGLNLEGLANAQSILEGEMAAEGVLALSIHNAAGQLLYRAGLEPGQFPPDTLGVQTGLSDNLGRSVGVVALNFSAAERQAFLRGMRDDMVFSALTAFAVAAATILLAAVLLLGPVQRRLRDLAASVKAGAGLDGSEHDEENRKGASVGAVLDEAEQRLAAMQAERRSGARA